MIRRHWIAWLAWVSLAVVPLLISPQPAGAQQRRSITGRVVDRRSQQPLAGARVLIVATHLAAVTNADGRFQLNIARDGRAEVIASRLGYESQRQVVVFGDDTASVVLQFDLPPAVVSLDQVLITAVGEQRRRELGNAIAVIDPPPITQERSVTSMADLLQARAAGVQILQHDGLTGTGTRIRIRGSNSVFLENEPVIYVDGVRVVSDHASLTVNAWGQTFSRLNDLNPDEIESVEIVRGPSAATLYGTQAANGIIQIKTKRGLESDPRWHVYVEQGVADERTNFPDNYEGIDADGNTCRLVDISAGSCEQVAIIRLNPLEDPETSPFKSAHRQQYGANVAGGSERVQYFLSGEWEAEDGVLRLPRGAEDTLRQQRGELPVHLVRPNAFERLSVRANLHSQVLENADLTAAVGFVSSDARIPNANEPIDVVVLSGVAGSARPEENGGWRNTRPEELFEIETSQGVERFTSSLQGNWQPFSFLSARIALGLDEMTLTDVRFQPTGFGPINRFTGTREGQRDANRIEVLQHTVDVGASVRTRLSSRIGLKTSFGMQYFRNVSSDIRSAGEDLVPGSESVGGAAFTFASEATAESRTLGTFIEQQVGVNDRLYFTAGLRADDGNNFGEDLTLVPYPKLSASWVISEEPFFPTGWFLDRVRLRAAWGVSGQEPFPTAAARTLAPTSVTVGGTLSPGVTIASVGNPGLKPERSQEIELGLDALLLSGRMGLEFNYYRKRTQNALMQRMLPPSLGVGQIRFENLGLIENEGAELTINAQIFNARAVSWTLDFLWSINHNTLLELCPPNPNTGKCEDVEPLDFGQRAVEGYPLGGYWERTQSFQDQNGDRIITQDELVVSDTAVFMGTPFPTKEAALSTGLTLFDRLRIGALFLYRGGHQLKNLTYRRRCGFQVCLEFNDPTTPLDAQATAAALLHPERPEAGLVESAWFVKLRELSFTFLAPNSWAAAIGARSLKVTLAGRNLISWTDYTGLDPEVNTDGPNRFTTSDFGSLPQVRYVTVRLDVGY